MRKRIFSQLLFAAALIVGVSAGVAAKEPIKIGWTAWSDAELVTKLAQRILEERMGFYQDNIEAAGFFSRMQLPIDDLQKAMYDAQETSYEEAVTKYMKSNPKRIDYWVTGEL